MLTVASVACNRHLPKVELPHDTRRAGKTEPGVLLHLRQGLLFDHSEMEGVSGAPWSHLDYEIRIRTFLSSGMCIAAITF